MAMLVLWVLKSRKWDDILVYHATFEIRGIDTRICTHSKRKLVEICTSLTLWKVRVLERRQRKWKWGGILGVWKWKRINCTMRAMFEIPIYNFRICLHNMHFLRLSSRARATGHHLVPRMRAPPRL